MATLQCRSTTDEIYSILTALILHRNLDELLKTRLPSRGKHAWVTYISWLFYLAVRQITGFSIKRIDPCKCLVVLCFYQAAPTTELQVLPLT